jgi:thioredoxin-related protein
VKCILKPKIIILALAFLLALTTVSAQAAGLDFKKYDEAVKEATQDHKLVMIFFWAKWCRYCAQIRQEVFENNEKVKATFDRHFVGVSVDIENDPDNISAKYKPQALPTLAFIRPDGDVLGILPGAPDVETFIQVIEYVHAEAEKPQTEK